MSNQTANPPRLVVLRQVEGPKWCVVEHMLENGKRQFASRIATSRDYASAAQIAMRAADGKRLPLVIEASGRLPRRFDPARGHSRAAGQRLLGFFQRLRSGGRTMTACILPLRRPLPTLPFRGTVVVMGSKETGFQVGHESSSGNSWGHFSGPYPNGVDAIAAAFALNRDVYMGGCDVEICDSALADQKANAKPKGGRDEF